MLENKMLDINKKDSEGLNAFWIACICGNGGVMRLLAERGIDIMNKDKNGNNVLHVAAKH
jgi:ankyrin repeat protein